MSRLMETAKEILRTGRVYKEEKSARRFHARAYRQYSQIKTVTEGKLANGVVSLTVTHQIRHGDRWFALPFIDWEPWQTQRYCSHSWTEEDIREYK